MIKQGKLKPLAKLFQHLFAIGKKGGADAIMRL